MIKHPDLFNIELYKSYIVSSNQPLIQLWHKAHHIVTPMDEESDALLQAPLLRRLLQPEDQGGHALAKLVGPNRSLEVAIGVPALRAPGRTAGAMRVGQQGGRGWGQLKGSFTAWHHCTLYRCSSFSHSFAQASSPRASSSSETMATSGALFLASAATSPIILTSLESTSEI